MTGHLLKDRVVLITGGSSGIGFVIAEACLKNDSYVIITGRNKEKLTKAYVELGKKYNNHLSFITLDLKDNSTFPEIIKKATLLSPNGIIDTLINNAGISVGSSFGNTSPESLDSTINTNIKGLYLFTQEFSNYLIVNKIKGNILNICSSSGYRPAKSPYAISKWAEIGFTKGIAKLLIKYDIVVNAIAPGPTAAGMMEEVANGDLSRKKSPAGRYVTAEEIANLSLFLISLMGRMIVGETVFITGGMGTLTFDDIDY